MQPFRQVSGRAIPLGRDNVDTDIIIPADYLKRTDTGSLGDGAFRVIRSEPGNVFDDPRFAGAPILLAGRNFGCGSSREHAVWAIQAIGIRAVIAISFAEIFRDNALRNGVLPVALPADAVSALFKQPPDAQVRVDLETCTVAASAGGEHTFAIDPFWRELLLAGQDDIAATLELTNEIDRFESSKMHHGWKLQSPRCTW